MAAPISFTTSSPAGSDSTTGTVTVYTFDSSGIDMSEYGEIRYRLDVDSITVSSSTHTISNSTSATFYPGYSSSSDGFNRIKLAGDNSSSVSISDSWYMMPPLRTTPNGYLSVKETLTGTEISVFSGDSYFNYKCTYSKTAKSVQLTVSLEGTIYIEGRK